MDSLHTSSSLSEFHNINNNCSQTRNNVNTSNEGEETWPQ